VTLRNCPAPSAARDLRNSGLAAQSADHLAPVDSPEEEEGFPDHHSRAEGCGHNHWIAANIDHFDMACWGIAAIADTAHWGTTTAAGIVAAARHIAQAQATPTA